ncbi:aminotransferase class V-fold PLP-dependent enzyme [Owenweeksia hongkongensis]|uniref:aminotransferase class V-fold PLP-dependent enzyme n=1 Tax=Owenweeksia hongkongensis TaxID=253245 RepID=UPI003A902874
MQATTLNRPKLEKSELEEHFSKFRKNIIGIDQTFEGPYGVKKIMYADWIASGRLYEPIEKLLKDDLGRYVANTHTETSFTGTVMTKAYHEAKVLIKEHVNAKSTDALIPVGTGMTGAVLKLQRMLGLKVPERFQQSVTLHGDDLPVVFISHMEHHSNQTSWLETVAEVIVINADDDGLMNLDHLKTLMEQYKSRKVKIASITSCSNVTGISTPYYDVAKIMHQNGGYCFVDFACSGPYVEIDMHPEDEECKLDAIFFSPHKFLGGPGTPGVLVFCSSLYTNKVPDQPGGGTVSWTNPWGGHSYFADIETREDGGTPGFLQTIKAALAIKLKDEMGVKEMHDRENEIVQYTLSRMSTIPGMNILAGNIHDRLGAISFYVDDLHFNLYVKLLNDMYGIQVRGGCSCAGTYGHYLLHVTEDMSREVTTMIDHGDLSRKPGWVRLSLHPTMTNAEVEMICDAIEDIALNHNKYKKDYEYHCKTNEYEHKTFKGREEQIVNDWFGK